MILCHHFSGYAKKSCWKVFTKYPQLLSGIGRNDEMNNVQEFVCRLYSAQDVNGGVNKARALMFDQGKVDLEKLPPTEDA